MPRISPVSESDRNPKVKELLGAVHKKLGTVPNIMATFAQAPPVLEAYLGFSGALAKGHLPVKLREQIALAVGEASNCDYCLAAHSALGRAAGLSDEEVADSRRGRSTDRKAEAALSFARKIVRERGWVGDEDVAALRSAGFNDGDVVELIANVSLNLFTNYFNHIAQPEIDFPKAGKLESSAACACG